jgi:hypothetical protein
MRAVVGLEPPGDHGDFVGEEFSSQRGIVGRDAEVLTLQSLIENIHVVHFVHGSNPFETRPGSTNPAWREQ